MISFLALPSEALDEMDSLAVSRPGAFLGLRPLPGQVLFFTITAPLPVSGLITVKCALKRVRK